MPHKKKYLVDLASTWLHMDFLVTSVVFIPYRDFTCK